MRAVRSILTAAILTIAGVSCVLAQSEDVQSEIVHTRARYSTTETKLGDMLDDPVAYAVLQRRIPEIIHNSRIWMARGMTLKTVQRHAGVHFPDSTMALIEADLAAVAPPQ